MAALALASPHIPSLVEQVTSTSCLLPQAESLRPITSCGQTRSWRNFHSRTAMSTPPIRAIPNQINLSKTQELSAR